jgi:c(7)-type cytochrome triheme protein
MSSGGEIPETMNIGISTWQKEVERMKKDGKAHLRSFAIIAIIAGLTVVTLISMLHASGLVELTYKGTTQGDVVFKHSTHATGQKLQCKDCHIGIFQMKQGTSGITNEANNKGEFCGKCHNGERAFSVKTESDCGRCHQPKS